jgi:hypothetical protein
MNVVTSLLGLVIVSHLSPKGSGRFTNLMASPVSRLRGHGRTLFIHPARAASSLREGATRQRRVDGRFLLYLVRVAAKLNHGRIATTHHD